MPAAAPASTGGASAAPPGFVQTRILAAESASLVALDPVEDETTIAPVAAAPVETIGGSALVARIVKMAPQRGDRAQFGKDRAATVRIASTVLVSALLVVLVGPALMRLLDGLPVIGGIVDQLRELGKYYDAFGPRWIMAWLGTTTAAGVVVAQMEARAKKLGMREDPGTRLNIALAGLVTLTLVTSALMLGKSSGWIAAGCVTSFFFVIALAIPAWKLPGARAMAPQTPRAWGLLLIVAVVGLVITPSLPTLVLAVVAFRHLARNWGDLTTDDQPIFSRTSEARATDEPDLSGLDPAALDPSVLATQMAPGKVDGTNRFSAFVLVLVVVLVASIGMRAAAVPDAVLVPDVLENPTTLPGAERGPTIPPPTP
ncbi:MAG: hypothetical protein Q7T55_07975 [Solirubrobacteraceae bacterium]|nr:hypothetical protein [Solirubrobacteraceae bacterium]